MVAMNEPAVAYVPPASPFDARPPRRLLASPEAVERRRANRRFASAARRAEARVGTQRIVVGELDETPPPTTLSTTPEDELRQRLRAYVCSDAWATEIVHLLRLRHADGGLLVPYTVKVTKDVEGKYVVSLATKLSQLMKMVAAVRDPLLAWPPRADDPANQLRPCCCLDCVAGQGENLAGRNGSVLYPSIYTDNGLSFDCYCNRRRANEDVAAELDPDAAYLLALSRVRERDVQAYDDNPTSGRRQPQRIVDRQDAKPPADDAWRHDPVGHLGIASRTAVAALRRHRWSHVGGEVKAVLIKRRLSTVGDLYDFIHVYGRRLGEVAGLTPGMGADVRQRLNDAQPHS